MIYKNMPRKDTTGYNDFCDNCDKPIKLLFKPVEDKPLFCKKCALALTERDIESTITSLKVNKDERFLERGAEFLAFEELKLIQDQWQKINNIKKEIRKRLAKEIKNKDELNKILVFLEKAEPRFWIK